MIISCVAAGFDVGTKTVTVARVNTRGGGEIDNVVAS
jgi:hypothetical protein